MRGNRKKDRKAEAPVPLWRFSFLAGRPYSWEAGDGDLPQGSEWKIDKQIFGKGLDEKRVIHTLF